MRRLLAYLIMMLTAIGVIVFNVQSVLETTNDGMEFGRGTELVFALEQRNPDDYDSTLYPDTINEGTQSLEDIDVAEAVMDRLDVAGVRNADVQVVEGDAETGEGYELRVTMSPLSSNELNNVRKVLSMTGSLTIGTFGDDYLMSQEANQFFAEGTVAEIVYNGTTPYVAVNLGSTTDFETMRDQASEAGTNHADDTVAGEDSTDTSSDEESDSTESDTKGTTLYLWANKMVDDTFEEAYGVNDAVVMEDVKNKVLAEMVVSNYDETTQQIVITSDIDGNAFTVASARALVNCLNASDYGFNITYLYENAVAPTFGNGSISEAYLYCGLALLVVAVLLVLFFGLSGLTGSVTMVLSTFGSLWLVTMLGFELSVSTLVGLFVVSALSVFLSLNYFCHVRREYKLKGDLEKANREGYRQAYFLSLDASVVVLIVSLFGFLFATGLFQTFFGTVMIGSIITFLVTNYLNKWATYWLTKDSKRDLVPTFALFTLRSKNERKTVLVSTNPKHFSRYAWPIFGSLSLLVLALALPLAQAFGGVGFTVFNNSGSFQEGYTLSVNYRTEFEAYDRLSTSERFLGYVKALGEPVEDGNSFAAVSSEELADYESTHGSLDSFGFVYYPETASVNTIEKKDEDNNSYFLTYFSVDVDRDLSALALQDGQLFTSFLEQGIRERIVLVDNVTVSLGNDAHFDSSSLQVGAYVLSPTNVYHSSVNLFLILFVLPLFAALYLFLRYGILVSLTTLATGEVYSALAIGLLSATRIPFNSYSAFGVLATFLVLLFLLVPLLGRNKVLLKELHARRDADAQLRTDICNDVAWRSLPSVTGTSIALLLFSLSFFLLNTATVPMAGVLVLGSILVVTALLLFALPFYHFLALHISFRRFHEMMERRRERKGIEKSKPAKDGIVYVDEDSPHETIIPGLNDFHH